MTYWLEALCDADLLHQLSCLSSPCNIRRAGEIIPEVGGLGLRGPGEKGPQVSQRAQNHLYNYCNC